MQPGRGYGCGQRLAGPVADRASGHQPAVFHVGHHRDAQDGPARLRLSPGTYSHGQVLAGRRGGRAPPDGGGHGGGPRPPGGSSTGSGSAARPSSSTTTTASFHPTSSERSRSIGSPRSAPPPTMYRFFIKEDLRQYDFSALRTCVVAGEPLNPEVYHRFKEMTGLSLKEGYGQTEMTLAVAVFPWMVPKPGSMGKPSPGIRHRPLERARRELQGGRKGRDRRPDRPPNAGRDVSRATIRTRRSPGASGRTRSTAREMWPGGTRTATSGSWAARTT